MALDWAEIEKNAGGNHKNYAADGKYKAKCDGVEIKEVGENGSIIMKFHFEDGTDVQYPTADHWLSFKNDNWRQWHNKCLMEVLGASNESAKKAVEMAESKSDKESIVKVYEACYKKLLAKKPVVEFEVYTENKYARAEFLDRKVAMPHGDENQPKQIVNETVPVDDPMAGAEEIDLGDTPF